MFAPAPKSRNRFLAVGRFIDKKRPDLTVRAFCEAAKDHPDAMLEMIGDGPLMPACKALVAKSGLDGQVLFHGELPHDAVRDRLSRAQFFLQHSVTAPDGNTEGLPTAIQEAMAAGAVVLSTRHAGIPEIVRHGETGLLVAENDEPDFVNTIKLAMSGGLDVDAMADQARATAVKHLDKRLLTDRLEAMMSRTIG